MSGEQWGMDRIRLDTTGASSLHSQTVGVQAMMADLPFPLPATQYCTVTLDEELAAVDGSRDGKGTGVMGSTVGTRAATDMPQFTDRNVCNTFCAAH